LTAEGLVSVLDGALLDAVAEHVGRSVDPERPPGTADAAHAVDVALHHVAAEWLARAERRLDVDGIVRGDLPLYRA
jgi:hypothetical protein